MSANSDPGSLYLLQQTYLLLKIRLVCEPGQLYALVLDRKTEAALLLVTKKDALLRIVTTVEVIDDKRRLLPFLHAIYFVEPLVFNFNCILADVHTNRYKDGTGLLLPFLQWDEEANRFFRSGRFLENQDVARYFQGGINYVHGSMVPVESRVFLADKVTPNSMPIYYNENCGETVLYQIRKTARAIVNAVIVADEYPLIRFYSLPEATHQAARLPELIADEVQRQLDDYARANNDYPPASVAEKPRAVLVICDRTIDLFAPLLHEFSYQAMAMDIVENLERNGVYEYSAESEAGEEQKLESRLDSEEDETWVALRHTHIIEASELVVMKINELIKNNPMMIDRTKAKTSSDLMYVVAHLQGFDSERRQVTLHKSLIDECLSLNASRKLAEFAADFEQNCTAKGISFEGVKNKHLHEDLIVLLARDDLTVNDKIRLVLIYGLYRGGLAESDFVKLAKFIGVSNNQIVSLVLRCFTNLHKLNFPIVKKSAKDKPITHHNFHVINNEGTYNTSRFIPGVKTVLQSAVRHELDEEWFPYFRDKPLEGELPVKTSRPGLELTGSLRNVRIKASWAPTGAKNNGKSISRNKQRVFCYVAGGITYSEIRLVYELSTAMNKDFYIGSEFILKPRDFLIGLQNIDDVKNLENLQLPVWHEMNMSLSRAPDHLIQAQPPAQPNVSGQVRSSTSSQQTPPGQNGQSVSSPVKKAPTQASVPQNYQKRVNQYATDLTAEPAKEKKTSRLKRLFK
ncbi:hypothetical protein PUMCH_000388 [Australozyma saopauloensis]|uniref:Sec1-like protein n=1 Tax=Australozyma saopauloensis TaxID=291208 RepID=A0AAX4H3P5_9ASCO|nr:hypothetical protein PUMCH_000388 [[Candida] saopauloensis]